MSLDRKWRKQKDFFLSPVMVANGKKDTSADGVL